MEDKQILDLYFARDEKAIEESDKKYGHYCFTVAYNVLFDAEDARECLNDTWHTTWNLIPPNRPNQLKYYLAKITRSIALNVFRKYSAQKRGGLESEVVFEEIEGIVADKQNPEKELEKKELIQCINHFLRRQKERDRNMFIRRYFYMESIDKIAKRYGVSANNGSVILSRMRDELKEHLRKEGYLCD